MTWANKSIEELHALLCEEILNNPIEYYGDDKEVIKFLEDNNREFNYEIIRNFKIIFEND